MARAEEGTLFHLPVREVGPLVSRVVLDVHRCFTQRLLPATSLLLTFQNSYLIEVYRSRSAELEAADLLIPGIFVDADEIGADWLVVGHHQIDPTSVEFPEFLTGQNHATGDVVFECGEIRLPLPYTTQDIDRIGVRKTLFTGVRLPVLSLVFLGRHDLIQPGQLSPGFGTHNIDLRYSPFRPEVYWNMPIVLDEPYHEKPHQTHPTQDRLFA